MKFPIWNIEAETGYKPITTFWQDFSIAEKFGTKGVQDTFNRAFNEWKTNYKYLTELVMVLNHKIFQHYGRGPSDPNHNGPLAKLYDELWRAADAYACDYLKGEELQYYYQILD